MSQKMKNALFIKLSCFIYSVLSLILMLAGTPVVANEKKMDTPVSVSSTEDAEKKDALSDKINSESALPSVPQDKNQHSDAALSENTPSAANTSVTEKGNQKVENIFIRVIKDEKTGDLLAMETSVIPFKKKDVSVTLIGAVHVADPDYYETLNKELGKYSVVLYELVADEGTRPQKTDSSKSMVGWMQKGMAEVLGFQHQLQGINYNADNFFHADMTNEEFKKSRKDRGETMLSEIARAMGTYMAKRDAPSVHREDSLGDDALIHLMLSKNRPQKLKKMAAQLLGKMDELEVGLHESAIITDRNDKVLKILKETIEAGHTNIAIFYGAGHLPDFQKKLIQDFKFTQEKERWIRAWDLTK